MKPSLKQEEKIWSGLKEYIITFEANSAFKSKFDRQFFSETFLNRYALPAKAFDQKQFFLNFGIWSVSPKRTLVFEFKVTSAARLKPNMN